MHLMTAAHWTDATSSNSAAPPPAAHAARPLPQNPVTAGAMPTRNLGRTGYRVGIFSLGGQAAVEQPNNEAVAVPSVERALDLRVNYIDTAAAYGGSGRMFQGKAAALSRRADALAQLRSLG
jgi:hypothetical protein